MAANGNNPARDGYTGFAEVVVSVSHFGKVAGLVTGRGLGAAPCRPGRPGAARAWGLKPGARIEEQLLHVPSMPYGYLRFTRISDVPQQPIRPLDARPWETGGLWLLYTRSTDDAALSRALGDAGWPTVRGVHGFDFGELAVNEVHQHGPDGMVLSIIEQLKPAARATRAEAHPRLQCRHHRPRLRQGPGLLRRRSSASSPGWRSSGTGDNPGLTLLADLAAFRGVKAIRTVIVHPQGENLGSVELIGWDGAQPGRDFSERAQAAESRCHGPALWRQRISPRTWTACAARASSPPAR